MSVRSLGAFFNKSLSAESRTGQYDREIPVKDNRILEEFRICKALEDIVSHPFKLRLDTVDRVPIAMSPSQVRVWTNDRSNISMGALHIFL